MSDQNTNPPFQSFPLHIPRPKDAPLPLAGVRVADFTRYMAGPYCTQTLCDLGAEVIKIEAVEGGDETRTFIPPEIDGESPYFLGLNRGKRSVALNLASEGGRRVARDIVAACDIVVENFSPGVMERLGLSEPDLRKVRPDIIYCAISGYGSGTSHADQPGFDSVFQAETGFMSMTGASNGPPMRTGSPIIDIASAMQATTAILAALVARHVHGDGQRVEVSMFDTGLAILGYQSMNYLSGGGDPVRQGNEAAVATPIGLFDTADGGQLYVSCGSQRSWIALAKHVLERPDLVEDPRFSDNRRRNENRLDLTEIMERIFSGAPRDHWIGKARAGRVPIGAVRTVGEAMEATLTRERGLVSRIEDASGRQVPNIGSPLRFDRTPVADPQPAPRLGADTEPVLRTWLGYDDACMEKARRDGAFSPRKPK
ncbi:formyl-CoA transferase [Palleronia aestuarii]|uniref:Formyl-CoA transferase n=1 Tax=Palleronia aestuarii TaxID=568105 RepID=A0A2W7MZL7_9RHOB|nr:CoA transferase [Palleronia aestuarii]PZX13023.1 formyl-CoA transferase [Palleronia aestuarii]